MRENIFATVKRKKNLMIKTKKIDVLIQDQDGTVIYQKDQFEVPIDWSDTAATIVASKYSTNTEFSVLDIVNRVTDQIGDWGWDQGYFTIGEPEDPQAFTRNKDKFKNLLKNILINQRASFNSPVWFNCGVEENFNQMSACFILPIEDNMESILQHTVTEGTVFKSGSGTGINVSKLRAKGELLSNKGSASGPISFMRGWDAFAGVIKSGGKVRRAAKLVCMDVDHPDIFDFIECKALEEEKAKILIQGGVTPEEAYSTVDFQNSNHSIRVTDEFMNTVMTEKEAQASWKLVNRGDKQEKKTSAKSLLRNAAEIAWATGDPGIQFHDRMNKDNPVPSLGEIVSTNPCSEFSSINSTSCNLASLNLVKYLTEFEGELTFNTDLFNKDIKVLITAMDILIEAADYPTPKIREMTIKTRPLGLGYSNLGGCLMLLGLPYDSEEGRSFAANITKQMTRAAYDQSIKLAEQLGSFEAFEKNKKQCLKIISRLTDASYKIDDDINEFGLRNSQLTLLAPCGTIGLAMDCDSTGIEPLFALKSKKLLAGGGTLEIIPRCVQKATSNLQSVYKTANEIHWKDHINMMAAVQPYLSGSISKTVNMPSDCKTQDVFDAYKYAWEKGLKSLAIYRDGSKDLQPLTQVKEETEEEEEEELDTEETEVEWTSIRRRLPDTRYGPNHTFNIAGFKGYITTGTYDSGELGEIFIIGSKLGSTMQGFLDSFATMISIALQYGVPLEKLVEKFKETQFKPQGITTNEDIRFCSSVPDYVFRWLATEFLDEEEQEEFEGTSEPTSIIETVILDGPACSNCGDLTQRAGACYVCKTCGETNGCS